MISVKQILYWTRLHRRRIFETARGVSVRFTSVVEKVDDGVKFREVKAVAMGETVQRNLIMYFTGRGPTSKVWVSCDCEYFLYHCEVALMKKGSSDENYSNGAFPKITNPRLVAHACKHIVAALQKGAYMLEPKAAPTRPAKKSRIV